MRQYRTVEASRSGFLLLVLGAYIGAGMIQYLPTANVNIRSSTVSFFEVKNIAETAGIERFSKDLLNILWGLFWPLKARGALSPRRWHGFMSVYAFWMLSLIGLGLFPAILGLVPFSFVPAGLRWLLLLHCSIGLYFLFLNAEKLDGNFLRRLIIIVYVALLVDILFLSMQVPLAASQYGKMLLGQSRLTGLFSHAGVAGSFAVGLAAILIQYEGSKAARVIGIIAAGFVALSAGSRWALVSIFLMTAAMFWVGDKNRNPDGGMKFIKRVFLVMLFVFVGYNAYSTMINQVNRGDMLDTQFEKGGRVQNTIEAIDVITSSSPVEFLFGQGLGVGTNTAVGQMLNRGEDTESYRFNMLVDNGFITTFFQFGLLGSALFWSGMLVVFLRNSPSFSVRAARYWVLFLILALTTATTSVFESFFTMTLIFSAMGMDAGRLRRGF